MKCLGITKGGSRCSRRPKYEHEFTRGCTTNVCYQHRSPHIITDWDRAIRNGSARDRPPQEIDNWLENFYEHWNKTNDIAASTRFASATYSLNATVCNYEMKYEIYVESGVFNTVSCDHPFCKDCIREWMTRSATCPVCRTIL